MSRAEPVRSGQTRLEAFDAGPEPEPEIDGSADTAVPVSVPVGQMEVVVDVPCAEANMADARRSDAEYETRATDDVRVRLSPEFGIPETAAPAIALTWKYRRPIARGFGGTDALHKPTNLGADPSHACDLHNPPDRMRVDSRDGLEPFSWEPCSHCFGGESRGD